jgi:hypothetical protein
MTAYSSNRFLLSICLLLFASCAEKQTKISTQNFVDSLSGIRTVVKIESSGTGAGITGQGPSLIKKHFNKYDSTEKLIYESYTKTECSGCICSKAEWYVTAYNPNGSYQKLQLQGDIIVIQVFNAANELVSKSQSKYREFKEPNWIDQTEEFF